MTFAFNLCVGGVLLVGVVLGASGGGGRSAGRSTLVYYFAGAPAVSSNGFSNEKHPNRMF